VIAIIHYQEHEGGPLDHRAGIALEVFVTDDSAYDGDPRTTDTVQTFPLGQTAHLPSPRAHVHDIDAAVRARVTDE
jgi:hypothetical protein